MEGLGHKKAGYLDPMEQGIFSCLCVVCGAYTEVEVKGAVAPGSRYGLVWGPLFRVTTIYTLSYILVVSISFPLSQYNPNRV